MPAKEPKSAMLDEENETSTICDNGLKHKTEASEEATDDSDETVGLAEADGAHLDGC
jgi:hypothetical protein